MEGIYKLSTKKSDANATYWLAKALYKAVLEELGQGRLTESERDKMQKAFDLVRKAENILLEVSNETNQE